MFLKDYKLQFRTPVDLRKVQVQALSKTYNQLMDVSIQEVEHDIVDFYSLVEAFNHQYNDPYQAITEKDAEVIARFDYLSGKILNRMVIYVIGVCLRECRHYSGPTEKFDNWWKVASELKGTGGSEAFKKVFTEAPFIDVALGDLVSGASDCFASSSWGSSYGGKAWKAISDHCLKFIRGEISAELFIDQAFSLEHNTSSVFNKTIVYTYTGKSTVKSLLNLQHLGAIRLTRTKYGSKEVQEFINGVWPEYLDQTTAFLASEDSVSTKQNLKQVGVSMKGKTSSQTSGSIGVVSATKIEAPTQKAPQTLKLLGKKYLLLEPTGREPEPKGNGVLAVYPFTPKTGN